ncbi:MAG: hypothetical protein ACYC0F_06210 [Rhodanobacter sp.]
MIETHAQPNDAMPRHSNGSRSGAGKANKASRRCLAAALAGCLLTTLPLAGCSAGSDAADASGNAANLARETPPIHVSQVAVLLQDGEPAVEHTYREALARCSGGSLPVKPLADDVVGKLGRTYLESWYEGARMAVKADRWNFKEAGASTAGCTFEPVHESRLTIVEPGSSTVADLVHDTATREDSDGVVREAVAQAGGDAADDTAQDDAKLRAAVMGELQQKGQGDLVGQGQGEQRVAGQPCTATGNAQVETCVWSGGSKWGFVTDTDAGADRMDAPVDSIPLLVKPAGGNGYRLTTSAMSVGTPIDGKVFHLPAGVAVAPAG